MSVGACHSRHWSGNPFRWIIYGECSESARPDKTMGRTIASMPWYTFEKERCSELWLNKPTVWNRSAASTRSI